MIEAVIKIGGSLAQSRSLPKLMKTASRLAKRHRLVVLPGGGLFADLVREQYSQRRLSDQAAHWMAIAAMDQFGHMLADLCENCRTVVDLFSAGQAAEAGHLPVLLPYAPMMAADPLPKSWEVTSDSIAAWVAGQLQAKRLLLLKPTDGMRAADSPGVNGEGALLERTTLPDLAAWEGVDRYFGEAVALWKADVWLINGRHPERLRQILEHGRTVGTRLERAHV